MAGAVSNATGQNDDEMLEQLKRMPNYKYCACLTRVERKENP